MKKLLSVIMLTTLIITLLCPMLKVSAATYTVTVSVGAGSGNMSRAEFYTTGAATVQSTSLTSGSDPALYNINGSRIADDEAGSSHWKYTTVSGTHYFAGTYSNGAAKYTISSTAPITLVHTGYNWLSTLGEYEGYYRIKHVLTGKYLTVVSSATNQYSLTLSSSSSSSSYQRWMFKTASVTNKTYSIINGGYTTRYLARDSSAPIYAGNYIDGYNSKALTSFNSSTITKKSGSTSVYIGNSTAAWALETNYAGDISPHFYENCFNGWEAGEWILEPIYIKGDITMDGKVTQADADLALKAAVNIVTVTSLQTFLADMNNDGAISTSDAQKISQML